MTGKNWSSDLKGVLMSSCPICGSAMHDAFSARLLKKYEATYRQCHGCGLLQTERPYWLDEAYSDAISFADTGLVMRNLSIASRLAPLLHLRFDPRGTYLDVAGGYGLLTRLMRDSGFDYYWEDKYCQNLLARGFSAEKATKPFSAITAIEVLEHVHDPLAFVQETLRRYGCRTLIFTTELYEGNTPPAKDWWYYAFNTGQHISFYRRITLEKIAARLHLNFYSIHGLHVFTDRTVHIDIALRLATGRLSRLASLLIKRNLGSRTVTDHDLLMKQAAGCAGEE